jgi:hypothetical protein
MRLLGFEAGGTRTGRSQRITITPALTVPGSNVIPLTVGWAAATPSIMVPRKYVSQKSCAFPGARLSLFVGELKTIKLLDGCSSFRASPGHWAPTQLLERVDGVRPQ